MIVGDTVGDAVGVGDGLTTGSIDSVLVGLIEGKLIVGRFVGVFVFSKEISIGLKRPFLCIWFLQLETTFFDSILLVTEHNNKIKLNKKNILFCNSYYLLKLFVDTHSASPATGRLKTIYFCFLNKNFVQSSIRVLSSGPFYSLAVLDRMIHWFKKSCKLCISNGRVETLIPSMIFLSD